MKNHPELTYDMIKRMEDMTWFTPKKIIKMKVMCDRRFKGIFGKKIENQIIVHPKNYSEEDGIKKIPPYMIWCAFN